MYISAVTKDLPKKEFKENVEVNGRGTRSVTTALLVAVFIKSREYSDISSYAKFYNSIAVIYESRNYL